MTKIIPSVFFDGSYTVWDVFYTVNGKGCNFHCKNRKDVVYYPQKALLCKSFCFVPQTVIRFGGRLMKVITLTLNPAFDVHCHVADFKAEHENLATVTSRDAGGKGVNISAALAANGVENLALVVLGRENAADFRKGLLAKGIPLREIEVEGRIRENITVHTDHAPETRISFAGFSADASLLFRVEEALGGLLDSGDIVTLTGRIPDGIPLVAVKAFLRRLTERGVRIVIDSKSFSLSDLVECKPYLIKPNGEEIEEYLGKRVETLEHAANAARNLHRLEIENVMITLGAIGAVLSCEAGTFSVNAPKIDARSTIGAGDSTIAGFLAAISEGRTSSEALRLSVAYGSAACLREGTQAPDREDVAHLYETCLVNSLDR